MAPNDLRNGVQGAKKWCQQAKISSQCCFGNFFSWFKFFVKAVSILLHSFPLDHFTSLARPCCKKYTSLSFTYQKMSRDEHGVEFEFNTCCIIVFWWIWILQQNNNVFFLLQTRGRYHRRSHRPATRGVRTQFFLSPTPVLNQDVGILILIRIMFTTQLRNPNPEKILLTYLTNQCASIHNFCFWKVRSGYRFVSGPS